jgi:P27 family predicted phage terminase small subunit
MRGRKPAPTSLRRLNGNPGKRGYNHAEPVPPEGLPDCPPHLTEVAKDEWARIAGALYDMGVLTLVDRAALAAYCQAYARWVEAEVRLKETPVMLKTPSGYVQQSPWLSVANKQMELMVRYMSELGITPVSRSRVAVLGGPENTVEPVVFKVIYESDDEARDRVKVTKGGTPVEKPDDSEVDYVINGNL